MSQLLLFGGGKLVKVVVGDVDGADRCCCTNCGLDVLEEICSKSGDLLLNLTNSCSCA